MLDRSHRVSRIGPSVFATLIAVAHLAAQGGPAAASPAGCESLMHLQLPGVALTVTNAQLIEAGTLPSGPGTAGSTAKLPAYCRLDGIIDRRTGAAGVSYGIGFALALPQPWNGRFLFQGGGGLNGSVLPPMGAFAAGAEPGLTRGFAVVSTDTGHQGANFDPSFFQDQQATLDFSYASIGRVAEAVKHIIAHYYGKAPSRSYFTGCSEGGRQAMLMAERYPTYFDGIVAGAPAMRPSLDVLWVAATLNEIAPKDQRGQPITRDASDGLKDGMVFNIQACRFDPKTLVCKGEKADGCLSMSQAAALQKAFAGPKDSKGRQVQPGFPFDTGIGATQRAGGSTAGFTPGLLNGGGTPAQPGFSEIGMDVDSWVEKVRSLPGIAQGETWSWTNLNTFSGHGGKLIFWHGLSDSIPSTTTNV
jgi:feruloyl esterase